MTFIVVAVITKSKMHYFSVLSYLMWPFAKVTEYGADCSWPIFSTNFSCNDRIGDRESVYHDFIDKCHAYGDPKGKKLCDRTERDRLEMNARQPKAIVVRAFVGRKVKSLQCRTSDTSILSHYSLVELHRHWIYKDQSTKRSHGLDYSTLGSK